MKEIWTMGEPICEIMRPDKKMGLKEAGTFLGPYASGAPAIFIDTAAKLKHPCGFIGTIGEDDFGLCVKEKLEKDGVNCAYLSVDREVSTGVAFVAYDNEDERTFIYHVGNAAAGRIVYPEKMPENIGIFHVMGCSMMPTPYMAECVIKAVKSSYEQGAMISFDPNIRKEALKEQDLGELVAPIMERCSIFLPGKEELLLISQCDSVEEGAKKLFDNPVLKVIVLKDGSRGCRVMTREEDFQVPVCKIQAKDSTGAGDSFDAGFTSAYLQGKSLKECAQIASAAAALNTAAFGPMEGQVTPEAVAEMMEKNYK